MKLILQQLTGDKYFLDVEPKDKVREVKLKIFEELEIKQKVHLLWQSKELEDGVTLRAMGISEDATVQMVIQPDTKIKLNIQTFKKGNIAVQLNDSSTLRDLMKELNRSTLKTTAKASDFYFEGVQLQEENLPLSFYGIRDGSVLIQYYQEPFHILLEDARSYTSDLITVRGDDTIKGLKEKIMKHITESMEEDERKKIQLKEEKIVIFHSQKDREDNTEETRVNNELDRGTMTLFELDVRPSDALTFIRYHPYYLGYHYGYACSMNVDIRINEESRRIGGVYTKESVQSLRLKIQHQLNIPYEKQVLSIESRKNPSLSSKVHSEKFGDIFLQVIDRKQDVCGGEDETNQETVSK